MTTLDAVEGLAVPGESTKATVDEQLRETCEWDLQFLGSSRLTRQTPPTELPIRGNRGLLLMHAFHYHYRYQSNVSYRIRVLRLTQRSGNPPVSRRGLDTSHHTCQHPRKRLYAVENAVENVRW